MKTLISRRQLLAQFKNGLGLAAISSLAPILISACKPKNGDDTDLNGAVAALSDWAPCPDQDQLSDQEKTVRASLKYVDQTQVLRTTCDNCKLYTYKKEFTCGGCRVVPGPIHPKGYCIAWIPRM